MSTVVIQTPASGPAVDCAVGFAPSEGIRQEEARLIVQAQQGCGRSLETLLLRHRGLIARIAARYRCRSYSQDDLVQEGIVGLIHAIDRWDPARGCRLSTYAVHWVRQAIARAVEQNDRLIHVPLQAAQELRRIASARELLERHLGRQPDETELAQTAGLTEERLHSLCTAADEAVSLEAVVGVEQEHSLLEMTVDPQAANPEEGAVWSAYRAQLRMLVTGLRPRERWVLEKRFGFRGGNPQTLDELSRQLSISRERVRQIEAQAIRKLRHALHQAHWD